LKLEYSLITEKPYTHRKVWYGRQPYYRLLPPPPEEQEFHYFSLLPSLPALGHPHPKKKVKPFFYTGNRALPLQVIDQVVSVNCTALLAPQANSFQPFGAGICGIPAGERRIVLFT
jgi:hypothetical protein